MKHVKLTGYLIEPTTKTIRPVTIEPPVNGSIYQSLKALIEADQLDVMPLGQNIDLWFSLSGNAESVSQFHIKDMDVTVHGSAVIIGSDDDADLVSVDPRLTLDMVRAEIEFSETSYPQPAIEIYYC